ncbi:MAG TPA: MmgE/PrpD family protein [Usitatibacter sp.]|nr:MmgE/PrpD family protein [Usitatibacter sp.]
MDPAHGLAEGVAALGVEGLAPATLAAARRLVADSVAVALAGMGCRDAATIIALAGEWGGKSESSVIGTRLRVPAPVAALANGTLIQALDYDDTDDASAAHVASTVLAAALALGEARAAAGGELLAAIVAGAEVTARIGRACEENLGFTSTSLYGAFGAAAAAARILGLSPEATRQAFGIVLSQAAGSTQTALDWPLSKHMQSGFAAHAGVLSALLAERGISGVENVFEGRYGFFNLYKGGRYRREPLLAPWQAPFAIESLSLKPYPSCRATHGPIEACEEIAAAPGFLAAEVAAVQVAVPPMAFTLAGQPPRAGRDPIVAAQFSIAHNVAAALVERRLTLASYRADRLADPGIAALRARVTVVAAGKGDFTPASVRVVMRDGKIFERTVGSLRGTRQRPLDDATLLDKIRDCLAFAPAPGLDAEALWDEVQQLQSTDVRSFVARLGHDAVARDDHIRAEEHA